MDDLISRKALLGRLEPEYKDTVRLIQSGESHLDNLAEGFTEVYNLIQSAPAVEAEPVRHGRWKQCFEDWRCQMEGDECSACGFQHYGTSIRDYHYCPNCGAKMDLEDCP